MKVLSVLILSFFHYVVLGQTTQICPYLEYSKTLRDSYMRQMAQNIQKKFPGSKFGLANYGETTTTGKDPNPSITSITIVNGKRVPLFECYKLRSKLTSSIDKFQKRLDGLEIEFGGLSPETSLMGIAMVAGDKNVGWSNKDYVRIGKKKKRVFRIIALSTDDSSYLPRSDPLGPPFIGDGTDTCKSEVPSLEVVKASLVKRKALFLGIVSGKYLPDWEEYNEKMDRPGKVVPLDLSKQEDILDIIDTEVDDLVCEVVVKESTTSTKRTTTRITTTSSTTTELETTTRIETTTEPETTTRIETTTEPETTKRTERTTTAMETTEYTSTSGDPKVSLPFILGAGVFLGAAAAVAGAVYALKKKKNAPVPVIEFETDADELETYCEDKEVVAGVDFT